jgi:hypothetical protein
MDENILNVSSWISKFTSLKQNSILVEVDRDFILKDDFENLYGLQTKVKNFNDSLDEILDIVDIDEDYGIFNYFLNILFFFFYLCRKP